MRALLRSMRPDNFEDISAVGALYRPGPMGANSHNEYADRKNQRKPVVPIHRELEEPLAEILGDTYGLIVYQEQVMAIAQKVAGYSLGQADLLRRAMGKKKKSELDKQFENFSAGMADRGYSPAAVKTLWDILVPFSDYAFNKAHSAAYGLVSYWTAYLKANYPPSTWPRCSPRWVTTRTRWPSTWPNAATAGITVLPPDVNSSVRDFAPVGGKDGMAIRFGLSAVRNVGTGVVASLVAARKEKGAFTDFSDFLSKVDAAVCGKKVVESLIKAGAFDSLGHPRKGLLMVHAEAVDSVMNVKRAEAAGQFDLFGELTADEPVHASGSPSRTPSGTPSCRLGFEREMLGLYVSGHPLADVEHVLAAQTDSSITDILDGTIPDRQNVVVGGILTNLNRRVTKKGEAWASATLEDLAGGVEVLFFPKTYAEASLQLAEDAILLVKAQVSRSDDRLSIRAVSVTTPDLSAAGERGPLKLKLRPPRFTEPVCLRFLDILREHPGTTDVHIRLQCDTGEQLWEIPPQLRVTPTSALMGDLKALLGADCLA